jgi:uncharacterized protein (DUF1501 family)
MQRRDLFRWGAGLTALAALGRLAPAASAPRARTARRLLFVFAQGGWDTSYALDPKQAPLVDVPEGALQRFGELEAFTHASRPAALDYFTRHAAVTATVRGVLVGSVAHPECQKRMATGTRSESNPDLPAIVAHDLGNDLPLPYLVLGDLAFTGPFSASAGRVGMRNQLVTLLDPRQAYDAELAAPLWETDGEAAVIERYAQASAARQRAVRGAHGYNRRRIDDFIESVGRGQKLAAARAGLGRRGRTLVFDDQISFALDALEQDLSQTVMLNTRLDYDTHADNFEQAASQELTFAGLARIMDELTLRPGRQVGTRMIDDTVVVCLSEFSRTPKRNSKAGKDHWPVGAAVIAGAGVRGGHSYGGTTPEGNATMIDFTSGSVSASGRSLGAGNLAAGILSLCGVDPAAHLDAEGFHAFAS